MAHELLVIGLDGATLDLVRPWAAAGRLPALAALMRRGAWGVLRSTVPAATFPAWTSLVTGLNPGRHGILDFTERVPGTYRVRFVNGSARRVPALWNRLGDAGRRVAVVTVPATYPPEPVNGVMVSGFDTPLTTAIDGSFVFPRALWPEIERRVGRLPFADFPEVTIGEGWHARARERLRDGIARRAALVRALVARERVEACMVVFGESDTAAHHFWRFHDPRSPRHAAVPELAGTLAEIYEALDAAVGTLVAAMPGATVAVVSDHGSGGASDRVVHPNRRLADAGLLTFRAGGGAGRLAGWMKAAALRAVPTRAQAALLRHVPRTAGRLEGLDRFGGIDWARTVAYSEELDYHPSVWLNVRGREPEGIVDPAAYAATRERVAEALRAWRDEAGRPVVARVHRREDVYAGPHAARAPDLLLELALVDGYSPSCLRSGGPGPAIRRLPPAEHGGGKGRGMNGAHRPDGLFILAGPEVRPAGQLPAAAIVDVLPTLLALAGLDVPHGLDGRPIAGALRRPPRFAPDRAAPLARPRVHLDAGETREMAARLAALGYLEPDA
ncbi:MAG TPA: alkaline phosphatase family protein [Candidatus Binatia bacterium]|nr:alkaline phosphatase family protein [Candidatus Binatia bacterium]